MLLWIILWMDFYQFSYLLLVQLGRQLFGFSLGKLGMGRGRCKFLVKNKIIILCRLDYY